MLGSRLGGPAPSVIGQALVTVSQHVASLRVHDALDIPVTAAVNEASLVHETTESRGRLEPSRLFGQRLLPARASDLDLDSFKSELLAFHGDLEGGTAGRTDGLGVGAECSRTAPQ